MKTNKQLKYIKILFFSSLIAVIYLISEVDRYVTEIVPDSQYALLENVSNLYPELSNLQYNFVKSEQRLPTSLVFALLIILLSIIVTYFMTVSLFKKNNQRILHIVDEIKNDDFIPSSLEGEIGLLEEKVYSYKKENEALKESVDKEKEVMNTYIENITHQIKTPITSIRLNEEMLAMLQPHELLEKNEKSFQHLDYLLNDLMTLSRLENGHIHFHLDYKTVHELMEKVQEETQSLTKNTHIDYEIADCQFYYDEQWLKEAICNIIKNAVEENVTEIHVKSEVDTSFLHIMIQDNGKGIDEKELSHIFERFYRSPHHKKKGNGIGLSLAKEIVEKHHGTIHAYNEDGAVFEMSFPLLDIKEKVSVDEDY